MGAMIAVRPFAVCPRRSFTRYGMAFAEQTDCDKQCETD